MASIEESRLSSVKSSLADGSGVPAIMFENQNFCIKEDESNKKSVLQLTLKYVNLQNFICFLFLASFNDFSK